MVSDHERTENLAEAWLDVPDPLGAAQPQRGSFAAAPRVASLTRAQVRIRRAVAIAACLAWAGAMTLMWGFRNTVDGLVAGQALALMALVVLILTLTLGKGRRGLGARVSLARLLAVCAPLLFMGLTLAWFPTGIGPFARLVGCFGLGLLTMVPMVALAIWSVRGSFAVGARWRGAALGAACGLGAAIVLTLHCDITFGSHVAIAHGLPIVLATLVGALLGEKVACA